MPAGEVFIDIYQDHGCDVAPSCLRCPLEFCKYDSRASVENARAHTNAVKSVPLHEEIIRLLGDGLKRSEVAKRVNRSLRTVDRVIARGGLSDAAKRAVEAKAKPVTLHFGPRAAQDYKPRGTATPSTFSLFNPRIYRNSCLRCGCDVQLKSPGELQCLHCGYDQQPKAVGA